jgi:uncharacterized membrane protein YkgB
VGGEGGFEGGQKGRTACEEESEMASNQLKVCLFLMRVSVFVVFFVWGLDKYLNPEHTSKVFQHFYFSPAFGPKVSYAIGTIQLLLVLGFLLGVLKTWTYGAVFLMHFVSTVSSYQIYSRPWDMPNILFWAVPMLAACYALLVLRREDTILTLGR